MDLAKQRLRFLPGLVEKLGYYVYALRDPRDDVVFYIGKGVGDRAYAHVRHAGIPGVSPRDAKAARIKEIHSADREVIVEIVHRNLPSEDVAYLVECSVIDALRHCRRPADLSNLVAGHRSQDNGWAGIEQLAHLAAGPVDIPESMRPSLLDPEIAAEGRRGFIVEPAHEATWQQFHGGPVTHLLPRKGGKNPVRILA